jgi:predicted ribosome quality control (RQC) complex YloA/Tae2 family protein
MFFDAFLLARARAEIEREAVGARVREVLQPRHDEVTLVLRREPPRNGLLLSSSPQFGRAHLTAVPDARLPPQPFGLALRKHLRGARLVAARQPGFDRALQLEFEECEGFGRECRRTLVVEIMGKHGNMALLDAEGTIVSCAKHVPARVNRYREVMEGACYTPPPTFGKVDPREATESLLRERLADAPDQSPGELLHACLLGMSRVCGAEVLARADEDTDASVLLRVVRELILEAESQEPVLAYESPAGRGLPARFAYPARLACCGPPVAQGPFLADVLQPLGAGEQAARRAAELRGRLAGAARSRLRTLGERLCELQRQLRRAEGAEELRRRGELLLAQPQVVSPYANEVQLTDYFAADQPTIGVALDPPGDLPGTAQRLFERYKRAVRVQRRVPPLLQRAEQEREYLEAVVAEVDLAEGLEDLATIEQELTQQGLLRERQTVRRPVSGRAVRPQPRRVTSGDGYVILYGTNHLQNEELVRSASPDDLWLHVQSAPGAHVLVRTEGDPDRVPRTTLLEAARLAARYSRLRSQDLVDVDYTRAKHVRKAKGERPGMVYYTHQRTLTVRLEAGP